jgi:hypothetical protein
MALVGCQEEQEEVYGPIQCITFEYTYTIYSSKNHSGENLVNEWARNHSQAVIEHIQVVPETNTSYKGLIYIFYRMPISYGWN